MSRKLIWSAQFAALLLCALALKYHYSTATVDELRWILAPTTLLVELLSGRSFEFESHTGYMSSEHTFVIAAPCAGVNFLITVLLMLGVTRLWRGRFQMAGWHLIPMVAVVAYVTTLVANTSRIFIALEMQRHSVEIGWLTANQLHRLEGIVVYFVFLLALFTLTEKRNVANRTKLLLVPLFIYYATTLGVPILNGSYKHAGFWEHSAFVLVLPLLCIVCLFVAHRALVAGVASLRVVTKSPQV